MVGEILYIYVILLITIVAMPATACPVVTPYRGFCTLETLYKLHPLQFLLSSAGGRHPQSLRDSSLREGAFDFVRISGIGKPSSPRRVAAIADGWCLGFCNIACGRETPSVTS